MAQDDTVEALIKRAFNIAMRDDVPADARDVIEDLTKALAAQPRDDVREALEKAAPFVGSASTRHEIIAGVDAAALCDEIDALLGDR